MIYKYLAILAISSSALNAMAKNNLVSEIAPYVYPNNICHSAEIGQYMPDGNSYLLKADGNRVIKKYDTSTGNEVGVVFDCSKTRESKISAFDSFIVSPDGNKLLIATLSEPIYRRSFKASYYVFDIERNILRPLSRTNIKQQSPVFSPDSRMVAFVADNNISLRKLDYDTEIKVTENGVAGKIINGVPDWVYEEEFSTSCSMAWSGDSSTLCFITFDESNVPLYSFPLYQGTCDPFDEYALYPGEFKYKYPVAGQPNSVVSVSSYDVETRKIKQLKIGDGNFEYIPRIDFAPDGNQLFVTTLNRAQTRMEIFTVNPKSTISKSLLVEESQCWIAPESYENLIFSTNSLFLTSTRSGFANIYEYSLNGSLLRNVTPIERDVTDCYGLGADGNIYYQAISDSPIHKAVYRTDKKLGEVAISAVDMTSSAKFSEAMNYYSLTESTSSMPPVTRLYNVKGNKSVRLIQDNNDVAEKYSSIPKKEFIKVQSGGYELNGFIIKPNDFDSSKKYPVIMTQYSGPGSQDVTDSWSINWERYAALKGFIVVCVDGRGTGGRGRKFMDVVYRNLGHYETIDQLNAFNYVASLPYVDSSRIGMTGWSYGGYETLMCVTAPNNGFKAAVAIAPVTDWRYYDSVYTERYMLTPNENEDGYNISAPINRASDMSCNLLIMSGTADDNVHVANTFEFVSRLQDEGIFCDMLLFPNKNHSIYGCDARAVVYGKMMDYFMKNL